MGSVGGAPYSAWVDLAYTDSCADPTEVVSLFSAGVNSPFGSGEPSFDEYNEAQLTPEQLHDLRMRP